MKTQNRISIWIVEDNALYQRTLIALVNDQKDMKCEKVFSSCETAVKELKYAAAPDVVLHDIGFTGMDGISSVEAIKRKYPTTQIIMITVYDDGDHIFDSLRVGATGYLLKSSSEEIIVNAIHDVVAGGSPMNSSIARKVIEYFSKNQTTAIEYNLSSREKVILEHITQGLSNSMISKKLHLSIYTVDAHLRNIYEKLHVHSRTEAAMKAVKEKLF